MVSEPEVLICMNQHDQCCRDTRQERTAPGTGEEHRGYTDLTTGRVGKDTAHILVVQLLIYVVNKNVLVCVLPKIQETFSGTVFLVLTV